MASGGARNRSGPQPVESSLKSAQRGLAFRTLDASGYSGAVPSFPLPASASDDLIGAREVAVWETLWTYPQAFVWAEEPWRQETLAEFCRLKAIVELSPDSNAALVAQTHRYKDQLGLSPAGLKENGWKIGQVAPVEAEGAPKVPRRSSSKARLKVVSGGGS